MHTSFSLRFAIHLSKYVFLVLSPTNFLKTIIFLLLLSVYLTPTCAQMVDRCLHFFSNMFLPLDLLWHFQVVFAINIFYMFSHFHVANPIYFQISIFLNSTFCYLPAGWRMGVGDHWWKILKPGEGHNNNICKNKKSRRDLYDNGNRRRREIKSN